MANNKNNNKEKENKLDKNKKYLLVRHGKMLDIGLFEFDGKEIPNQPSRVLIKTERGLELGHLVGHLTYNKNSEFKLQPSYVQKYFENSGVDFPMKSSGEVVRFANHSDISEEQHLEENTQEEIKTCKKFAKELNLDMRVIDAEHIFGGERIIFYFMADGRIDFRELVKKLAQEYQTRIEMRQIGSRDEAKLLGDFETCGQQCCCQRFLNVLKPVNMRMAKLQKATLDPSKISGYCGRLKCCLRYEDKTYRELKKSLPKKNTIVETPLGRGKVEDVQILTQLVVVNFENSKNAVFSADEIKIVPAEKLNNKNKKNSNGKENNNNKKQNNSQ